jgi:hypothetical protein
MLEDTSILALCAGLLLGLLFSRFRLKQVLLLAYHTPFRFWHSYEELYDAAESRFTYEMIDDDSSKSHVDFLSSYQEFQPQAESSFKKLWNTFAWQVGRDYGIVFVVSLLIFWNNYFIFLVPFMSVQAIYFMYLYFHKHHRFDFFALLMISMLLAKEPR